MRRSHGQVRSRIPWWSTAVVVLALAISACTPTVAPTPQPTEPVGTGTATPIPEPTAGTAPNLTLDQLRNLTYPIELAPDGEAQLVDGSFSAPAAPGSAAEITIDLSASFAFGDINGDGVPDAAVVLVAQTGGSGTFYYLSPVLNQDGTPNPLTPELLGDRVELQSLAIAAEQIDVEMITAGPDDPLCCPTQQSSRTFALSGTELEIVAESDTPAEAGATVAPDLTLDQLRNATYPLDVAPGGEAQLVDGSFSAPAAPDSASEIMVDLSDSAASGGIAYGDIDGDGVPDAAVVLVAETGGSGIFYYLAPVLNRSGTPEALAPVLLGDRIEMQALSVEAGEISVDMLTAGPDDPLCCPTQETHNVYALVDGALELVSGE